MSGWGWARMLEGRVLAGRYAVERLIGEGGMGAVFSGTQLAVQRRVAIKILLPGVADDASIVERFHREATLVARIARRGVPQIIDFDRDPVAGPFVVMELLVGESLADRLTRRERLHVREAATLAASVLETLEVVHAKGIVHRDLKPANVFLSTDGPGERAVKVLDFGVARVASPAGDLTVQGAVLGTPRYMAPEQAAGDRGVDGRADLYAVGAILYACLGGKAPYAGLTGEDVLIAVRAGPPTTLSEASPGLPAALVAVVDRAMARAPGDRFQTAAEMRVALVASLADLPEAPPPSAGPASLAPASAQATVQERPAPIPSEPREGTEVEARPSTRTPGPSPRASRYPVIVAAALLLAAGAYAVARPSSRDAAATAPQPSPARPPVGLAGPPVPPELRDELDRARAAWRAGDAPGAKGLLEAVVHEVEHSGARAPSPAARVAAEALLLLGDLDERAMAAPAPRDPKTMEDLGPETMSATREQGTRAQVRYSAVAMWGSLDLVVCGEYRAGRVGEKLDAFAREAEIRDLALMRQPAIEALYPGGVAQLRLGWSVARSSYRIGASASYDAAVSTARFVDGPTVDPADGTDCRVSALARRDALAATDAAAP